MTGAKDKALQAKATIAGQQVVLAKPTTYMNLSGEAVGKITRYYKVWPGTCKLACLMLYMPLPLAVDVPTAKQLVHVVA